MKPRTSDMPAPPDVLQRVRALVDQRTEAGAAKDLNISVATLFRILGGGNVMRGTMASVELALSKMSGGATT